MSKAIIALALAAAGIGAPTAQGVAPPSKQSVLKFAIIGDSGTGDSAQYKVAEQLIARARPFPTSSC
jgi:hypothetical protein